MPKILWNVSPGGVLDVFENAAPCSCHRNPHRYPTYNVRTRTSNYYVGGSQVIKDVIVECTNCGAEKTTNVEYMGITESNFNP